MSWHWYCGCLCHLWIVKYFSFTIPSLVSEDCVTSVVFYQLVFWEITFTSTVPHYTCHSCPTSPPFHSFSTHTRSQRRASLNVQVVMTTTSAALNAALRLWRSSYTVAHLRSVNVLVITQNIHGKQLKGCYVLKASVAFVEVWEQLLFQGAV